MFGVPERIRTSDTGIRNPVLYPTELRGRTTNIYSNNGLGCLFLNTPPTRIKTYHITVMPQVQYPNIDSLPTFRAYD